MKKVKERILVMFGITLISFMLGIINVNAAAPIVNITSSDYIVTTGTTGLTYTLTVDYSLMPDLINLSLSYRVNGGPWITIIYNPLQTSHSVVITTGFNSSHLQNIEVRAVNSHGSITETIEPVVLLDSRNWTDPATGLSGTLVRFPIGTIVEVEVMTDPMQLAEFPFLNMGTVYRVRPILDHGIGIELPAILLQSRGIDYSTSYLTVMYPVPQAARMIPGIRGYVFDPSLTHFMTSQYTPWLHDGNLFFPPNRSIFMFHTIGDGYVYYTIATGIDPSHHNHNMIDKTPPEAILTPPENIATSPENIPSDGIENPPTGVNTIPYILLGVGVIGALVAFMHVNKKNKFHKI